MNWSQSFLTKVLAFDSCLKNEILEQLYQSKYQKPEYKLVKLKRIQFKKKTFRLNSRLLPTPERNVPTATVSAKLFILGMASNETWSLMSLI